MYGGRRSAPDPARLLPRHSDAARPVENTRSTRYSPTTRLNPACFRPSPTVEHRVDVVVVEPAGVWDRRRRPMSEPIRPPLTSPRRQNRRHDIGSEVVSAAPRSQLRPRRSRAHPAPREHHLAVLSSRSYLTPPVARNARATSSRPRGPSHPQIEGAATRPDEDLSALERGADRDTRQYNVCDAFVPPPSGNFNNLKFDDASRPSSFVSETSPGRLFAGRFDRGVGASPESHRSPLTLSPLPVSARLLSGESLQRHSFGLTAIRRGPGARRAHPGGSWLME